MSITDTELQSIARKDKKLVTLTEHEEVKFFTLYYKDGRREYDFSFDRVREPRSFLACIRHLNEKPWFTKEHLDGLFVFWKKEHDIDLFGW